MFETFTNAITRWVGSTTSIILHSIFFVGMFGLVWLGVDVDTVMLVLTTAVSLEAIYLALFIQRSVNLNTVTLEEAAEDIQGIEEDIEDISEDVEGIEKDIEDIGEEVEDLSEGIEEVGKDLDELEGGIDSIQVQPVTPTSAKQLRADIRALQRSVDKLQLLIEQQVGES